MANSSISFWENGINEPKANYILKLAKIFNVSTDYLLGLEDDFGNKQLPSERDEPQSKLSPLDRQILEELQEMDEIKKQNVLRYIHGINHFTKSTNKSKRG